MLLFFPLRYPCVIASLIHLAKSEAEHTSPHPPKKNRNPTPTASIILSLITTHLVPPQNLCPMSTEST